MLAVDLAVQPGREAELRSAYLEQFRPTITQQPGFRGVELFEATGTERWLLLIDFESEEARLKWVDTPQHAQVWPKIERCCGDIGVRLVKTVDKARG